MAGKLLHVMVPNCSWSIMVGSSRLYIARTAKNPSVPFQAAVLLRKCVHPAAFALALHASHTYSTGTTLNSWCPAPSVRVVSCDTKLSVVVGVVKMIIAVLTTSSTGMKVLKSSTFRKDASSTMIKFAP